jgi:diacylglycerol kinase (ATP)
MKTLVVANPVSGHGRAAEVVPRLLEALAAWGVQAEAVFTTAETRPGALEEAILGAEIAVAVGGDGTVNRVVQAVVLGQTPERPGPAVAIVPAGTGNVAARVFGFPGEISRAARIIAGGASRAVDAGVVLRDGRVDAAFLLWLGAGLDGALIHAIARRRSPFRGTRLVVEYFLEGPRTLWRYPFPLMRLETESLSGDFVTVMLANVGRLAIGSVTTRADPADGQFDVVAIPPRSRLAWCFACLMAGLNVPDRCPGIVRSRARRMRLSAGAGLPVQIDGEPLGYLPVEVEVRPAALRLVAAPQPEDTHEP